MRVSSGRHIDSSLWPIRHSQRWDSYHVQHSGESTHHAILLRNRILFTQLMATRKGNVFILITRSARGFFRYSHTLCPFIMLNDGRSWKESFKKEHMLFLCQLPLVSQSRSPIPVQYVGHGSLLFPLGGRTTIYKPAFYWLWKETCGICLVSQK